MHPIPLQTVALQACQMTRAGWLKEAATVLSIRIESTKRLTAKQLPDAQLRCPILFTAWFLPEDSPPAGTHGKIPKEHTVTQRPGASLLLQKFSSFYLNKIPSLDLPLFLLVSPKLSETTVRMIPPLPPTLLQSNPQFALLHKTLTTTLLDPDASTKATNTTYLPVEEQVTKRLTQDARQRILLQGLQNLAVSDDDHDDEGTPIALTLPPELRELVYIISTALLTTPPLTLTPSQTELLDGKIQELTEQLPQILAFLSHSFIAQKSHLYALSTATSANQPAPSKLPNYTLHLQLLNTRIHLNELRNSLISTSTALSNQLTTILTQHTSHLITTLTHLSRHTHGVSSRHTLSRSNHHLTISTTLSAKIALLTLEARRATYSPPTQTALVNYGAHLNLLIQELEARKRTLEDELRLYAECDGREGQTIGELARRYEEVVRETAEVKGDVERLGREMGKGEKGTGRGWQGVDIGAGGNGKERKVSRRDWEIP